MSLHRDFFFQTKKMKNGPENGPGRFSRGGQKCRKSFISFLGSNHHIQARKSKKKNVVFDHPPGGGEGVGGPYCHNKV